MQTKDLNLDNKVSIWDQMQLQSSKCPLTQLSRALRAHQIKQMRDAFMAASHLDFDAGDQRDPGLERILDLGTLTVHILRCDSTNTKTEKLKTQ